MVCVLGVLSDGKSGGMKPSSLVTVSTKIKRKKSF